MLEPTLAVDAELPRAASRAEGASNTTASRRIDLAVAVLVGLLATVPFLHKPLHIDDPADLQYVRQILIDPWDPYGFEFDWGEGPIPAIYNYHPPLKYYYHALWLTFLPLTEWSLHLSYVPLVIGTAVALIPICRYFSVPPAFVIPFWILGPGYLPGQNAMLDVPALACALSGTAFLVRYFDKHRWPSALAAGALLAAAMMTKYSTFVYWIIWFFWLLLERACLRAFVAALVPPLAVVLVWGTLSYWAYGLFHPSIVVSGVPGQEGAHLPGLRSLVDSVVFLGGAVPGLALFAFCRSTSTQVQLLASVGGALAGYVLFRPERLVAEGPKDLSRENLVWWCVLATVGLLVLLATAVLFAQILWRLRGAERRRATLLLGWFWLSLLLGSACAPFVAMRRVLDAALAGTLIAALGPRKPHTGWSQLREKVSFGIALLVNLLLGYTVAISDYAFASVYPYFARVVSEGQERFENRAWCYGYWGWMYYAEKYGLKRYVPGREEPQDNDMFVWPDSAAKPAVIPESLRNRLQFIFQKYFDKYPENQAPIRLMSKQAGAGYYSNAWGPLPYAWAQIPIETLRACVVTKEEEPPPPP